MTTTTAAKKLYDAVIQAYIDNPELTMSEILNIYLADFNDEVSADLTKILVGMMGAGITDATIGVVPLTPSKLSSTLYHNAKDTAKSAFKEINKHLENKATIREIREGLYDGFGYDELLPIKKTLPKYLSKGMSEAKVNSLKTKPLKKAYMDVLNAKNDRELEKALYVALEQKARYYANRIAKTEEHRAFVLADMIRQRDEGIKFVKWSMSSLHKIHCICDHYANADIGYGKGIYPFREAPVPVYSTHPSCLCILRDHYREPSKIDIHDPHRKTLESFTEWEQKQILGSVKKWSEWKSGKDTISIFQQNRSGSYPMRTVGQLLR